ncbi:MAG: FecR domain-containing protein [Thermoguttaceae bacterium]|nr:FecR domain-containing protein [Thermoguttaceae bacterium]
MNDADPKRNPMLLYELFLSDTISPEEAAELYGMLACDPNVAEHLRQNVFIDFLLREDGDLQRRASEANEGSCLSSPEKNAAFDGDFIDIPIDCVTNSPVHVQSYLPEEKRGVWSRFFASTGERSHNAQSIRRVSTNETKPHQPSRIPFVIAVVTAVLLFLLIVVDRYHRPNIVLDNGKMVAKVVDTVDAVWDEETFPFRRGQETGPNRLFLKSGMVKLRFIDETELILKGPGEYTVNNARDVFCSRGSLSVRVNRPESGFGITTPSANVIDRGTEFFVDVENDTTKIGVVTGRVDLIPRQLDASSPKVVLLTEGNAMRTNLSSVPSEIPLDQSRFISGERFRGFLADYTKRETAVRVETEQRLDSMPDLLARFDFSERLGSTVPNRAVYGRNKCPSGHISDCRWDEGRLEGTQSLLFGSKASSVKFDMSGQYESLTLLADVRISALSNWGSILFATGGSVQTEGEFLWQITSDGEIHLRMVSKENTASVPFRTKRFFTRQSWGGWYRLAVVLDSRNKTISHYVDGKQVALLAWNDAAPITLNSGTIGNAPPWDQSVQNRFLDGNIGNFIVIGKALTQDEIANVK